MISNKDEQKAESLLSRYSTFRFASECTSLMERARNDISDIGGAYLFLASNALELYAKSFMCLRWEKEDGFDIEEINKRAWSFGHDLDRIYHYQGVGKDFLSLAGITKTILSKQKSTGKNLNYHYFEFHIPEGVVRVYPVDSLRYGELASKKNDFIIIEQTKLLNLCNSVRDAAVKESYKFY